MDLLVSNFGWILLILTVIIIFLYKKISNNPDAMTSKFKTRRKTKVDSISMRPIIKEALQNSGFKNIGFDEDENRFYAKTRFSMSSWSEYVEVKIDRSQNETEIEFKSICAMPTQIYDWGKNKRNYTKFESELKKLMPVGKRMVSL
jgi:hypothetical protein